jgi:mRNA interferase RelE/StbE
VEIAMPFSIYYLPVVHAEDLPLIDHGTKERIRKAIKERLTTAPQSYGKPLRKDLRGYWKLRVGDYRVVFKIAEKEVWVIAIRHRKSVYTDLAGRLLR